MARPREFDTDTALRAITLLFWEHGYEATSMHDIERSTGLRKQSLYRAFGDKRAMYLAALAAYEREEMKQAAELLAGPGDAASRFARLFRHIIEGAVEADDRRGCFLCNACVDQAALVGHSMGGHGALVCYLRNPGLYESVSAFSPICNPTNCPWGTKVRCAVAPA